MAKIYVMRVPKKQIWCCGDMLRYDDAYEVLDKGEDYRVKTLRFTLDRWASFGYVPNATEMTIPMKEWDRLMEQSVGFTEGVRFAQAYLSGSDNRYQVKMIMQSR